MMCLISWELTQKEDPHKLFGGDFRGQKGGPKRAIFGHKKFSFLFFAVLKKSWLLLLLLLLLLLRLVLVLLLFP